MFLLFPPQIDIHKGSFDPQMIGKKTTRSPGSYTSYLTASLLSVPWRSLFVVVPMIAFARIFTFGIEHSFLLSEPYQHYNINEQRQNFLNIGSSILKWMQGILQCMFVNKFQPSYIGTKLPLKLLKKCPFAFCQKLADLR